MEDQTIGTTLGHIEGKLDLALVQLKRHDETLYGNGHDGVVKEVDRLTVAAKQHKWVMGTAIAAFVAAVGDQLWPLLKRLFS